MAVAIWSHAYPHFVGDRHEPGFAIGDRQYSNWVARFYSRPSHEDPGTVAHAICSAEPDAIFHTYPHRNSNEHSYTDHNNDADFNSHCYVNFGANLDTYGYARATHVDAATIHTDTYRLTPYLHADGDRLAVCDGNSFGDSDTYSNWNADPWTLKDRLWICFPT